MLQELLQLNERQSKRISEAKLELAEDIDSRIAERESYIDSFRKTTRRKNLEESLERQKEIITIVRDAEEQNMGLSSMDIMAVLAIRYNSVEKDKLLPYANSISAMAGSGFVNSEGTSRLRAALQNDLVSRIEKIIPLITSTVTSMDLAKKLGLNYANSRDIIISLNLLDIINKVIRLPTDSTKEGGPYVWINPSERNTEKTIPYWNVKYVVLLALNENNGLTQNDLTKDQRISNLICIKQFPGGKYKGAHFSHALNDLIHSGLVSYENRIIKGEKGARTATVYFLTSKAKQLVELTEQNRYLDEELRKALLGEIYSGLKPSEENALQRIKRVAEIYANKMEGESAYILAKRIGENESYAESIFSGKDPLRFFKEDTLRKKFFPYLNDSEIKGIEVYLEGRRH